MSGPQTTASTAWVTRISDIDADIATLYGYRLDHLASARRFADVMFLALTGDLPTQPQSEMVETLLVIGVVHGVAPSGALTRTLAACGASLEAAVAGGLLSISDVHGGATEQLAKALSEANVDVDGAPDSTRRATELADGVLAEYHRRGERRIPGFGHPLHTSGDPRAAFIFERAQALGVGGTYCAAVREIGERLTRRSDRPIRPNIDGASAGVLLDLGIGWRFARAIMLTSRSVGLAAHAVEQVTEGPRQWREIVVGAERYVGPDARDVP